LEIVKILFNILKILEVYFACIDAKVLDRTHLPEEYFSDEVEEEKKTTSQQLLAPASESSPTVYYAMLGSYGL
jgi:hypothetical protein